MKKEYAIQLLGGSVSSAARALNITYQAVSKWPEALSPAISDRVVAAVAKSDPLAWPESWGEISDKLPIKPQMSGPNSKRGGHAQN